MAAPSLTSPGRHWVPSLTMPTARHFWKRQYWQRFRRRLSTGQFLLARQTYLAFFWTVRCGDGDTGTAQPGQGLLQAPAPSTLDVPAETPHPPSVAPRRARGWAGGGSAFLGDSLLYPNDKIINIIQLGRGRIKRSLNMARRNSVPLGYPRCGALSHAISISYYLAVVLLGKGGRRWTSTPK